MKTRATWRQTLKVLTFILLAAIAGALFDAFRPPTLARAFELATPTSATEFWAAVGGLTTIAILIVTYRGLRSLSLMKHDMLTRATRDAREAAVSRCVQFGEEILTENAAVLNQLAAAKVPVFVKDSGDVRFNPDRAEDLPRAREWVGKLSPELYRDLTRLMNKMEVWAMYFVHGLADQNVAYPPCSNLFISFVMQSYPMLLVCRSNSAISGQFPNLVMLYEEWQDMKKDEERNTKMALILDQLEQLQSRGTGPQQTAERSRRLPVPLGTNID